MRSSSLKHLKAITRIDRRGQVRRSSFNSNYCYIQDISSNLSDFPGCACVESCLDVSPEAVSWVMKREICV